MAAATRKTYCIWVVNALRALVCATPHQVYRWIEANEAVPVTELTGLTSGGENRFQKNVRWARFTLFKSAIVSNREGRGIWTLT